MGTWHAPGSSWINDLSEIINGSGTFGFVFDGSDLPPGVEYGPYNWCNMPHVRPQEYPMVDDKYELEYVEVIHRHHKRTPYANNTFPHESYRWECTDEALFYSAQLLGPDEHPPALAYWKVFTSPSNPFSPSGFQGTCLFPQITREGLDDSAQHGRDLYDVYNGMHHLIPTFPQFGKDIEFRVTNNVLTSQVASMEVPAMRPGGVDSLFPLLVQPPSVDSLEPSYTCDAASDLYTAYSVGSSDPAWTKHLSASQSLVNKLDQISGVSPDDTGFHQSWDHYYDNLSARQCHAKPLPCESNDATRCVTQEMADEVYRLGQYEYSYIYRDSHRSLEAAVGSFGVWIAELSSNIRNRLSQIDPVRYRHNVAHDGSVSRLLSILQADTMVWPGMGAEVVFEVYRDKRAPEAQHLVRVLWGGRVLRSSHPTLGLLDMLDLDTLLSYFDELVGSQANKVFDYCHLSMR